MAVWALVPVRPFTKAKSRLADSLSPQARAALAEAMLTDVLATLAKTAGFAGILVVTSDPRARTIAEQAGAHVLLDEEAGLNAAVALGQDCLDRLGASAMVVVPADLPFITTGELDLVLSTLAEVPVVIAPAVRDGGTNLLGLSPVDAFRPAYGPDSATRHAERARDAGLPTRMLMLAGAGHDIDLAEDLVRGPGTGPAMRTRDFLQCSPAA